MTNAMENEVNFEEALEKYLSPEVPQANRGGLVQGKVVRITPEYVLVDVGYKSEGQIPVDEFKNVAGLITVQEGDFVEVLILKVNEKDGTVFLSYDKAKRNKVFEILEKKMEEKASIKGTIVRRVKGGYAMNLLNIEVFLPGSHVDLRPVHDMDALLGKEIEVIVLKINRKRSNIIVSRRVLLEEHKSARQDELLSSLYVGQVIKGTVKNLTDYGAFIDLGGLDGLLHITDISWKKIKYPKDVLIVGKELDVKVLEFDKENSRVSLGVKQLVEDPWLSILERYPVGTCLEGKVTNIVDYGVFVEMFENIEGLVHISEMSWTRKLRHPSQMVKLGDIVDVIVLHTDIEKKRISLGMKQVYENPWEIVARSFPKGTVIEGVIKNITDFGMFIAIEDGIDGLIHVSDISWTKKIKHPSELYNLGDFVQAKVLLVDKENEKFTLGIKQLEEDPWLDIPSRYPVGTILKGTISNITEFGLFVGIEDGIEGLVHISEISNKKIKDPAALYKEGNSIEVQVIHSTVTSSEKKLGLSIKRCSEDDFSSNTKSASFSKKQHAGTAGQGVFGDTLMEKLIGRDR
ncbi:MAG: 30S ribosomal protein S1 [Desulfovibrionaceae bacterium]